MTTYNLFISHSWTYSDQYDKLVSLLRNYSYFTFKNYSVPKDDPIHRASNASQLRAAIKTQMQCASCVLILAGVYSTYSKWINEEISIAQELGKKIIAISPWGADRVSRPVAEAADEIVGWNTSSIVRAIRGY